MDYTHLATVLKMYPRKLLEAFAFFVFSEPVLLFVTGGKPEARADFTAPFVSAMACDSRGWIDDGAPRR